MLLIDAAVVTAAAAGLAGWTWRSMTNPATRDLRTIEEFRRRRSALGRAVSASVSCPHSLAKDDTMDTFDAR